MSDRQFPREKINYKRTFTTMASIVLPVLLFLLIIIVSRNLSMDSTVRIRVILRYGAASISIIGIIVILYHFIGVFIKHKMSRILTTIVIILLSVIIHTAYKRASRVVIMKEDILYIKPASND